MLGKIKCYSELYMKEADCNMTVFSQHDSNYQ